MSNADKSILFVDLDGTLIKSDVSFESFIGLLKKNPFNFFRVLGWLIRGKPFMKRRVSNRVRLDVESFPYNADLLQYLRNEKEQGRRLVLASASDQPYVQQVADHLKIFEGVLASDGVVNCSGANKLKAIKEYAKGRPCAYAGNSSVDKDVWKGCQDNIIVSNSKSFISRMHNQFRFDREFYYGENGTPLIRAMRPYQWSKNLLLFAAVVLAHKVLDFQVMLQTFFAFIALSACASAIYLINDLFDLEADRRHHTKKFRPLASGALQVKHAIFAIPILLTLALFLTFRLPYEFAVCLDLYVLAAILYSFRLKQIAVVDIIVLALLYVIRVLAGGMAGEVFVSQWLLSFSLFMFTSLACIKRFSELKSLKDQKRESVPGRGYGVSDIEPVAQFGAASAFVALLVLVFYLNSKEVQALYRAPQYLWLVCPLVMYWIMHVWLLAYRGHVNEDPVVFALRDKASYLVGVLLVAVLLFSA